MGGVLLVREPCTDMHVGHVTVKRSRLGKYTRGLPMLFFDQILSNVGKYEKSYCMFSPWVIIGNRLFGDPLNKKWFVRVDSFLCKIFRWNWKYSRKTFFDKFAPGSVFVRFEKE